MSSNGLCKEQKKNDLESVGECASYFATKQRVLVNNIFWHFTANKKNTKQHHPSLHQKSKITTTHVSNSYETTKRNQKIDSFLRLLKKKKKTNWGVRIPGRNRGTRVQLATDEALVCSVTI